MDRLRIAVVDGSIIRVACCRCGTGERSWDRIAGKAYCPNCEEALVVGEAEPLVERAERNACTICNRKGTVRFLTFPLNAREPLEMDLCGEHLRCLLGRRLAPAAFHQLRRQLSKFEVATEEVFLLHGAFYDLHGRALRPAVEL